MKKSISIDTLLKYQKGELSPAEHAEVKAFLSENPHYEKVLSGLKKLRESLPDKDDDDLLRQFLENKKAAMKRRLFGKTNKGDRPKGC